MHAQPSRTMHALLLSLSLRIIVVISSKYYLEPCWAPIDELYVLGFDLVEGKVDLLGRHIPPVEQAAGHVLVIGHVAFDQLVAGVEALGRHLGNG